MTCTLRKISPTALNSVSAMPVHTTWTKSLQELHTVLVLVQRTVVMETLHLNSPCRQYKSPERCIGVKKQQAFSLPVPFLSLSLCLSFSIFLCLASLSLVYSLLEMDKSKYLEVISSVFVWDLCKWIQADYFGSAGLILRLCGESWRIVRWYVSWNSDTCVIEKQRVRERRKTAVIEAETTLSVHSKDCIATVHLKDRETDASPWGRPRKMCQR